MRNVREIVAARFIFITLIFSVCLVWGAGNSFKMEEFSVFDYEGDFQPMLLSGTSSEKCTTEPTENVKAYPTFNSDKPLYGKVLFFGETLFPRIEYCFALDESEGTGKGYDRLYFDGNRDFDLSNDAAVKKAEKSPGKPSGQGEETFFDSFTFSVDGLPVTYVPRFQKLNPQYQRVSFICPTARRGTIQIGSLEHEAILVKMVLPGGYDHPFSYLMLGEKMSGLDVLGLLRQVDGQLYQCSATPTGETVTVQPYSGDYGTLSIANPGKKYKTTEISMGWILAKDQVVDLGQCTRKDGRVQVPVGDYMPLRIAMQVDDIRLGYGVDFVEEGSSSPTYAIKIRKDETFAYRLDTRPTVRFESPKASDRVKCGDEIRVSAAMLDSTMNALLSGLEDMTKPEGEAIKLPDGTTLQRYQSIDPVVSITDSAGKQVAEGKMPFG